MNEGADINVAPFFVLDEELRASGFPHRQDICDASSRGFACAFDCSVCDALTAVDAGAGERRLPRMLAVGGGPGVMCATPEAILNLLQQLGCGERG